MARRELAISVQGVSKRFCRSLKRSLVYGAWDIGRELLLQDNVSGLRKGEFWALQDISFELKQGEALGLVGPNGSGKTTLLRILSGLIKPCIGEVRIYGRLAPMIALGAGFNPVLSGRENLYVNMSILGMNNGEIKQRFDEVVEFAEIGHAIDAPLRTYSSGMAARLGFSSAIHTNAEIVLIDEVLAVGDIRFRTKCYRKLAELRRQGVSVILVSHSPVSIMSVCDTGFYVREGIKIFEGSADETIQRYENDLFGGVAAVGGGEYINNGEIGESGFSITSLAFVDGNGTVVPVLSTGDAARLRVRFQTRLPRKKLSFNFIVREFRGETEKLLYVDSEKDGFPVDAPAGAGEVMVRFPVLNLRPGVYTMKFFVSEGAGINIIDAIESYRFSVKSRWALTQSQFYQPRHWSMRGRSLEVSGKERAC